MSTTVLLCLATGLPRVAWPQAVSQLPETQSLHVLVGKSVVINMETRLRRVMVGNPNVADAVTTTPTQVVVTGRAVGVSSLILWDESGRSRLLDVYMDLDVAPLRDGIQLAYPQEEIQVAADGDRLIVSGTVSSQAVVDDVMKMASVFSKNTVNSLKLAEPPREKQILLEVKFAEIDRTKIEQLGFNIFSTGAANTIGAISTQQFGPAGAGGTAGESEFTGVIGGQLAGTESSFTVSDILNIFLFRPDINLAATIRALQQRTVLQILAEPNLLAMNGKPAKFLAGGEMPFPVVQGGTNFTAVTIQFRPFGVKLEFTGSVVRDGVVRLQVAPEVSSLDYSNAITISGFTVPAISTRRAETELELKDGQSFGIAGLIDQRTQALMYKVPGIGDIPIIGQLFRSRNTTRTRSELMVLVTPHVVDPVSAQPQPITLPKSAYPNLDKPDFDKGMPKTAETPETDKKEGEKP